MSPTTALILYVASLVGGIIIASGRHRWLATALCLLLGPLGFLFALCLKARCPNCREYYYSGAKVCPHCGRNTRDGKVTVRR